MPNSFQVKLATMYFIGLAVYWLQSLEDLSGVQSWEELYNLVCKDFDRDQHNLLLRQFFHVKQNGSVAEYIEKFDELVHQILAHDAKFNSANVVNKFIDGLRDLSLLGKWCMSNCNLMSKQVLPLGVITSFPFGILALS